jgi:propanol-preferring alcohol dehydrogenase
MKAYRFFKWQEAAKLVDIDIPEPGPGQVRLKVAGNGICGSDLHLMHNWTEAPSHLDIQLPMTVGHEVGGYIEKLGPGVEGFKVGKAALITIAGCGNCKFCTEGFNQYCQNKGKQVGMGLDGGLAEYVIAPAGALIEIDGLDPAIASPLVDAGLSSYHAVKRILPLLKPDTTVAIIGVGGLGHLAIQEIKALSKAKIIAYDLSEETLKIAKELGADEAYKSSPENFIPNSCEAVLDFVGAGVTIQSSAKMIKPLGHIVVVGRGPGSFEFKDRALPYGAMISTTFGGTRRELMELVELVKKGAINPHIEKYKLSEIELAFDRLKKGEINGRAVIIPD